MEKKRTKIAYFTAVGVFLVLLVVLGLTYRETPLPTLEVEGEPVLRPSKAPRDTLARCSVTMHRTRNSAP